MTATLIILAVAAILFMTGRFRSDLVAVCATLALVFAGVLRPAEALAGFSNSVVIMMVALFVVGGGIFSTGLAKMVGSRILTLAGQSETRLLVLLIVTTSLIGAFVSNTGTVALMLPIVVSMARAAGLSSSRFLMPLAFASSMGGMMTLIGTPPNMIVSQELEKAVGEGFGFFSFTPVGIICIVVGVLVLIPLSGRFLRGREQTTKKTGGKTLEQLAAEYQLTKGVTAWRVAEGSPVVGQTVRSLDVRGRYGITVLEVRRVHQERGQLLKRVEQFAAANVELAVGDVLYVNGPEERVRAFAQATNLVEGSAEKNARMQFYDVGMAEVLLLPTASLAGHTIEEANFRKRYGVNVLGVRRRGEYLLEGIKDIRLHASDVVLVQGAWKRIGTLAAETEEWVVLGQPLEQARRVTLDYKAPVAAFIMLLMVVAMLFCSSEYTVIPVMAAAVLMVITGCLRNVEEAYKSINWESIVLFAAMLPMSTALDKTGASEYISTSLVDTFGGFGPYVLLAAVYLATSLMTLFISNTVTAALMAPIALAAAQGGDWSPVSFLMAVTVAASMCFASPFSTPPNALVMAAGGYQPIDYVKVGLPLQLVMAVIMVFALPLLFPFN